VASLFHLLPLLLTKQRGLGRDNSLWSYETRKIKKRGKEERERGEKRRRKEGLLFFLVLAEKNHQGRTKILNILQGDFFRNYASNF